MAPATEATPDEQQPQPLRLSRVFHAPRETVFMAWTSADHYLIGRGGAPIRSAAR